ncbi:IS110 family transposase ISCth8 [Sporomusa silvacetica DSM 10669]|uniref:IS110 family transposase ISCth8 n=1 Tax=Sporomusa silvacetica DSM 10669 TaxID=1123289 RepID=A0ABZ3ITK5_9FIRM|nr:IS110 family transposase [Sporomusa silvacetica]OZC19784.1 transposase IS116/IS110/IS902 family protein [Sporomusa silvacetica DSM 10669]
MLVNRPAIGIDVAKNFCFYAAVSPTCTTFLKPFRALNTKQGLLFALGQIKKVEEAFNSKPVIVLESTGHYSQRIVHFFLKQGFEVYHINPLISHSIKNSVVRKVKTDRVDALELAKLVFVQAFRPTTMPKEQLTNLKVLTRTRGHLVEQRAKSVNQLQCAIEQIAPLFPSVLNPGSLTALTLVSKFPTPCEWIEKANNKVIMNMLETLPRQGKTYGQQKYAALVACAEDAQVTGISLAAYASTIRCFASVVQSLDVQIKVIDDQIKALSEQLPEVALLRSIPGIGDTLAPIILGEIGDIERFIKAKQLVAFSRIDPSVKQSGNFIGTKNKVTKRGSPFLRHALYIAATTSVRKESKGSQVNSVIYEYYQRKIETKTKKQALAAVMNKLLRIIFSVLKNKQAFRLISPNQQVEMYQQHLKKTA